MTTAVAGFPLADDVRRRAGSENFSVASLILGARTRARLLAVYDFARLVDELGDTIAGDRLAALDEAEAELDRAFAGRATTPIFRQLQPVIASTPLPRDPFLRLIEANRRDQVQTEYETFDDLVAYCDLSANPVGELVLHVFGAATPERIELSNDVCTALQVIEHLQDVREDALAGRIYLPREDRDAFGVEPDDLTHERAPDALRALVAFECDRASQLIASGTRLAASLPMRARIAIAGYTGGGLANLAAIAAAGHDVLRATPKATRATKIKATVRVLAGAA
jgi:squalene synthase HpnC